jgi:hypothetical protein
VWLSFFIIVLALSNLLYWIIQFQDTLFWLFSGKIIFYLVVAGRNQLILILEPVWLPVIRTFGELLRNQPSLFYLVFYIMEVDKLE